MFGFVYTPGTSLVMQALSKWFHVHYNSACTITEEARPGVQVYSIFDQSHTHLLCCLQDFLVTFHSPSLHARQHLYIFPVIRISSIIFVNISWQRIVESDVFRFDATTSRLGVNFQKISNINGIRFFMRRPQLNRWTNTGRNDGLSHSHRLLCQRHAKINRRRKLWVSLVLWPIPFFPPPKWPILCRVGR